MNGEHSNAPSHPTTDPISIDSLRHLTELMAEDSILWHPDVSIHTDYVQQALRYLTDYIEGGLTFQQAYDALKEMQP
jgi:hypothetical protein